MIANVFITVFSFILLRKIINYAKGAISERGFDNLVVFSIQMYVIKVKQVNQPPLTKHLIWWYKFNGMIDNVFFTVSHPYYEKKH